MKTKLILVGGFLGAGKTTLLAKAAELLDKAGKKAGLVTNDQAEALVDTVLLERISRENAVKEVSGSCFCCNYPGFQQAVEHLQNDYHAEVILAEPVGSCTDLSATILQPLKKYSADTLALAPLSVLADPEKLKHALAGENGDLHPGAAYIVEKQMDEADYILLNKTDRLSGEEVQELLAAAAKRWPQAKILPISAQTGEGVDLWLQTVLASEAAGLHLAVVDYDVYAEGEAALGWLNTSLDLSGDEIDFDDLLQQLLSGLSRRFAEKNATVGHIKALLAVGQQVMVGNLTGRRETLRLRGSVGKRSQANLTVNARVEIDPEELKQIVLEEIAIVCAGRVNVRETALRCLRPGRPAPTYRFDAVVC